MTSSIRDSENLEFLWFGYVPPKNIGDSDLLDFDFSSEVNRLPYPEAVANGVAILSRSIESALSQHDEIVVPISGGLDSRALLAEAVKHRSPSEIYTYTFGRKGSYDFEIGNQIARKCGTKHREIDLERVEFQIADLIDFRDQTDGNVVLFYHPPLRVIRDFVPADATHFIGYMGDPLVGSHLPLEPSTTWENAIRRFVSKEKFCEDIPGLFPQDYKPNLTVPEGPLRDKAEITFDEQLDFSIRQMGYVRSTVFPKCFAYDAPFLRKEWKDYSLSLNKEYRYGQKAYIDILKSAYPELFAEPVKMNFGLSLDAPQWRIEWRRFRNRSKSAAKKVFKRSVLGQRRSDNYLDFDEAIRARDDLKGITNQLIGDLARRCSDETFLEGILQSHLDRKINASKTILTLCSLELRCQSL